MLKILFSLSMCLAFGTVASLEWECPAVTLQLDGLYTKCSGDDLSYAILEKQNLSNPSNPHNKIHNLQPHFGDDFGFRLGAFGALPCYELALHLEWTHLRGKGTSHGSITNGSNPNITSHLTPTVFPPIGFAVAQKSAFSSAKISCYYDTWDLYLGMPLLDACWPLQITPFTGLRGAVINENFTTHFNQTYLNQQVVLPDSFFYNTSSDMSGIGPIVGLDADYFLGCGFSLIGRADFAWLFGRYSEKSHTTQNQSSAVPSEIMDEHFSKHVTSTRAMADFRIGLDWVAIFSKTSVAFAIAWESHLVFNQTHFEGRQGNIGFQGLMVRGQLEF